MADTTPLWIGHDATLPDGHCVGPRRGPRELRAVDVTYMWAERRPRLLLVVDGDAVIGRG